MKQRYENLDGLRTYAAIGIILMHVLSNGNYDLKLDSYLLMKDVWKIAFSVIGKLGDFVLLFFIISAFSMCCGYFDKIKNNEISVNDFYKKRYLKILPYFSLLVLIDVVVSGLKVNSFIEGFADVTLMYGLLPNNNIISVIGVGWALGVIFVFYIIFPFFVFLLWNPKRAWFTLVISVAMYYCANYYFIAESANIMKYLCYFVIGGVIYIYRDNIQNIVSKYKLLNVVAIIVMVFLWYFNPYEHIAVLWTLLLFGNILCYAISIKSHFLSNRFTKFISSISLEIYLGHMFIFRICEKINFLHLFDNEIISYLLSSILVIIGSVLFAMIVKIGINKVENIITKGNPNIGM